MNTLDRYLYKTVILYTFMAMAVLLVLGALFLFITNKATLARAVMARRCILVHPAQYAPAGVRIAAHRRLDRRVDGPGESCGGQRIGDYESLRGIGMAHRLARGAGGLTLSLIMFAIGEYAAPPMAQFAKREKTTSKLANVSFAGPAVRGSRTATASCGYKPAKWTGHSEACRSSN